MKPKLSLCLLLCLMLLCLPACQEKNSSAPSQPAASQTGEAEPLRVLADFDFTERTFLSFDTSEALSSVTVDSTSKRGLERIIKEKSGFSVKFEFPPVCGNERDVYLTNLRVEIMGGAGPDVFLCTAYPGLYLDYDNLVDNMVQPEYTMPVFPFPNKAMQNRLFLPLSKRIENARFMEFDKLTPTVMEAGQYEGEQYLMPTGYTVPVICYPKSDFSFDCPKDMTWQDMGQAGPELAYVSTHLVSSLHCGYLFSPFLDYERDELAFSEEELLGLVKDARKRIESMDDQALPARFSSWLGMGFSDQAEDKGYLDYWGLEDDTFDLDEGLTIVPVYSVDGGYQATVTSFAAINANTRQPDEAFFFLDYWLSEECQSSAAYGYMNWQQAAPTMEGLMTSEKPCTYMEGIDGRGKAVFRHWRMTDAVYEDFCRVKENISNARFATPVDGELSSLMGEVVHGEGNPDLEKLTHEAYMRMKMMAAES